MASHSKPLKDGQPVNLYNETTINSDTTTVASTRTIPITADEIMAISTVSNRTDGTYTVTIQHSPDGTNWYTWKAGSAQSANGAVLIYDTTIPIFPYVRASILSASTTTGAKVKVELFYGTKR